jgi:hypothetical protein
MRAYCELIMADIHTKTFFLSILLIHWLTSAVWYCYIKFWDFNILIKNRFWNEMATESILNTDILIRDRACILFFGSEILRKLIFCPPRVGHLRQCKSPRVVILLHCCNLTNNQNDKRPGRGPVWKVCIARRISPALNFDAFYIFTIKFSKSPARIFQTFQSGEGGGGTHGSIVPDFQYFIIWPF